MKKVGITGGIGTGKSIVCKVFESLGIPVFNSDFESKNILNTSKALKEKLIQAFGNIYLPNGQINKPQFGFIIFNDKEKLKLANSIIHPAVAERFEEWCTQNRKHSYVLKEAAILFESGAYKGLDHSIAVTAPEEIRIQRIMDRDGATREEVKARMDKQWPAQKVNRMADFVITNSGQEQVLPQVLEIHESLT